jgi:hypothetical protein
MIVYYLKNTSLNKEEDHNNSEQTRKNGFDGTGERESIPEIQYNSIYSRKFGKGTHRNLKLANAGTILSHVS